MWDSFVFTIPFYNSVGNTSHFFNVHSVFFFFAGCLLSSKPQNALHHGYWVCPPPEHPSFARAGRTFLGRLLWWTHNKEHSCNTNTSLASSKKKVFFNHLKALVPTVKWRRLQMLCSHCGGQPSGLKNRALPLLKCSLQTFTTTAPTNSRLGKPLQRLK